MLLDKNSVILSINPAAVAIAKTALEMEEKKIEFSRQAKGELYESAAFAERFARYKAQYAFPEEN